MNDKERLDRLEAAFVWLLTDGRNTRDQQHSLCAILNLDPERFKQINAAAVVYMAGDGI